MSQKFKLIDLFSGAGGMTSGFVDPRFCGGFKSVFAIDNEKAAVETYNANFADGEHQCLHADIEDWLQHNSVPKADVVIGGPPCQGFSLLNKQREGDERRALWEPFMDFVELSGASIFVMENVQGLLKSQEFQDIRARAEKLGFKILNPSVINMADYGVPQTRKRTIALGVKQGHITPSASDIFPPPPTHADPNSDSSLPSWRTVRHEIADLPPPVGTEIRADEPAPENLQFGRNPTDKSIQRYKAVPPGGNRFDLQRVRPDITPKCWIKKTSGGTDLFGRLWWDRPSVTIRTEFFKPEKGRYLHPEQHRPITHREAARLMSFPDEFVFRGSKIEIAKQIGNAVPPVFAGEIAKLVRRLLNQRKNPLKDKAA